MKRCGSRMIWGTALVLILGTLTTVETLAQVTATLAVDNAYIVCWGGATAITSCDPMPPSFHGAYAGGPQPNTHTIPATSSDYIYVVAWSDDLVAQGFLGEFSGNLGTVYSAMNSSSPWQVCPASPLVSEDRDIPDQPSNTIDAPTTPPSIAQLNTRLASCTWQSVAIGPTNGSPPWGMKAGISTSAQWIWFNSNQPACQGISAPFAPGCNHQEYLIFRIPASLIVLEEQTCVQPPSRLIAWWPMDEQNGSTVVTDIAGSNNGTPQISAIGQGGPNAAAGIVDSSLYFHNNAANFIIVPNSPSLNPGTNSFTIDAWVKPDSATLASSPSVIQNIVDKLGAFPGSPPKGYRLDIQYSTVRFRIDDGTGATAVVTAPVSYDTWQFIAAVADRSNSVLKLYIDGALVGSAPIPSGFGSVSNNDAALLLGGTGLGYLDEVELFNQALSQQDIQAIYNAGPAGKCKPQPPPPPPPPPPVPLPPPAARFSVCAAGADNIIDDIEILSIIDAWIKQHSYQTCGVPTDVDVLQALDTWIKAGTRSEATAFVPLQVRMIALSQNPVRTSAAQFVIEGNGISQTSVRVFTLNGREVFSQTNHGNIVSFAKAGELPNGVYLYIVRVRGYDGREYVSEVRKLVILR